MQRALSTWTGNPQNAANDIHDAISNSWVDGCLRSGFASSSAHVFAVPTNCHPEQDSDGGVTATMVGNELRYEEELEGVAQPNITYLNST